MNEQVMTLPDFGMEVRILVDDRLVTFQSRYVGQTEEDWYNGLPTPLTRDEWARVSELVECALAFKTYSGVLR